MAEALVGAVEVEAVDQLGHGGQPRHVLLQAVALFRDVEQRTLQSLKEEVTSKIGNGFQDLLHTCFSSLASSANTCEDNSSAGESPPPGSRAAFAPSPWSEASLTLEAFRLAVEEELESARFRAENSRLRSETVVDVVT